MDVEDTHPRPRPQDDSFQLVGTELTVIRDGYEYEVSLTALVGRTDGAAEVRELKVHGELFSLDSLEDWELSNAECDLVAERYPASTLDNRPAPAAHTQVIEVAPCL